MEDFLNGKTKTEKKYRLSRKRGRTRFFIKRMEQAGWDNLRQFIINLVVRGKIVKFEPQEFAELSRLLRTVSNNVNQIAAKANTKGRVQMAELDYIKEMQQKLWKKLDELLNAVAKAQEVENVR